MGIGRLALNLINLLKAFYRICLAKKLLKMVHKTHSTLVWRSHSSSFSISLNENLQYMKSSFEKNKAIIFKFKSRSWLFGFAFDNNSGIHSTQQKVRKLADLKFNSSKQTNK